MKLLKPSVAIFIIILVAVVINLQQKRWKNRDKVIEHDVHSYYSYLPLVFIYDDLKVKKDDYRYGDNYYFFWQYPDKNGKTVAKMTCGLAIMYSPFFLTAHFITQFTDYPSNGFSKPYKKFLLLASIFYLFIALNFLVKILKHYSYSEKNISITVLLVGLGTNLLAYSSQIGTYSHVYSFCLFLGFIYNTIKWHENQAIKRIVWLGLLFGLISLIRPSNALILLFFLFYGIQTKSDFKWKALLIKRHFFKLLIVVPLIILVWYPQLRYWKIVSGEWLYYSYKEEGFYFLDPKILEGLFSFRKGWLVYTPMMTFALIGIFFLKEQLKKIQTAIIVFMVVNIYVIFSWWCWWYGGTFGQRVMIESYALLAIPMASFVAWVNTKKIAFKILFYCVCGFFVWLNIFQMYQFENTSLHHDSMSAELYFKQFGKYEKIKNFDSFLDWADYDKNKYRGKEELEKKETTVKPTSENKIVNIKAPNGMFWCTEWDRFLIADKPVADAWEEFVLLPPLDGKTKIVSYDGKYITNDDGFLVAKSNDLKDAETLNIKYKNDSIVNIFTDDSLFVVMDTISKKLVFDKNKADDFILLNK